ncbi:NAD binding Rossmann fold oxidoreductase [Trichophyton tonsurans CBS 112818]|uniref:D-xylose 1-dehydrogenase (NADP(+), D-xylono-1,5-lactone-forming) n=2 Tax=Trichophyton TaxID=5550 RepID=F2PZM8_TRIEC|nr:NAD binding Rossmann fold oxidoreductase [Trichophyton tonsurans CBS 112818]EGE07346.1 NAD binding Rossmann fold oxidoreductase [Trichophyton equinum CBS 127.97]
MTLFLHGCEFARQYTSSLFHGKPQPPSKRALKLGVLSTAKINAAAAVYPAQSHPDVDLYAIASTDARVAKAAIEKYGFSKSYGSFQELLDDPLINIVHISLPCNMFFKWATNALAAGKHVLCEKPSAANVDETTTLIDDAERRGLILQDAFPWQFHPAAHRFKEIVDSEAYGRIIRTDAWMTSSPPVLNSDPRWQYDQGGGSLVDGSDALAFTQYALRFKRPKRILSAAARPSREDSRVDAAMHALLLFEDKKGNPITSRVYTDMSRSRLGGIIPRLWELPSIEVETDVAIIYFYNAMMPHIYHYISITDKRTGMTEYKTQNSGGPLWDGRWTTGGKGGKSRWSTYRWQLEAFVEKVRGKEPICCISNDDTIYHAECIDRIYTEAGMPVRADPEEIRLGERGDKPQKTEKSDG